MNKLILLGMHSSDGWMYRNYKKEELTESD